MLTHAMLALVTLLQVAGDSVFIVILKAAAAILLPPLATYLVMLLTKLTTWVDALKDWEKRALVAVYGIIIAGISHALGLMLPEAWGALASPDVQAVLAALLAYVIHRFTKSATTP
jgi:hypothetical protein